MEELIVKAPAKINLGLHVISKRDDDYHNIETIFYPINLYDVITFKESDKFIFTTDSNELININDNLVVKAKEILEKESKKDINVNIHLEKKIPIGAGLGGGSSDAAVVLKTLNKKFKLNIDDSRLKLLALRLGSDVPFFLNPEPAYASNRGETLERRSLKINHPILVVNPGIKISTKWAYSNITAKTPENNLKDISQEHLNAPQKLDKILKNDFEGLVLKNYPSMKKFKDELKSTNPLLCLMSGSGSTFFALFKDNLSAEKAKIKLEDKYFVFLQMGD